MQSGRSLLCTFKYLWVLKRDSALWALPQRSHWPHEGFSPLHGSSDQPTDAQLGPGLDSG